MGKTPRGHIQRPPPPTGVSGTHTAPEEAGDQEPVDLVEQIVLVIDSDHGQNGHKPASFAGHDKIS